MYQRALQGKEKAVGSDHTSTPDMFNNLGLLYAVLGKPEEADRMYQRALQGYEKGIESELDAIYIPALNIAQNLAILFGRMDKVDEMRQLYVRALRERIGLGFGTFKCTM